MNPFVLYDDSNPNNTIFAIKGRKYDVPVVTLSSNGSQKLSNLLNKELERAVYWNEYKTKCENKNTTNGYMYFLKSNFLGVSRLFVFICSN